MSKNFMRIYAATGWLILFGGMSVWDWKLMVSFIIYILLVVFGVSLVVATVHGFNGEANG